jgi:cell division ATPase FtsA
MGPVGMIDFGCYYTEFAAQLAPSKSFDAIIRIGSVHITNDISIGLRIPIAQAGPIGSNEQLSPCARRNLVSG